MQDRSEMELRRQRQKDENLPEAGRRLQMELTCRRGGWGELRGLEVAWRQVEND